MGDIFTTIAAALVDLNTAKLDVIGEDNKIPTEYIDGLDDLEIDHKHLINYDLTGVSSFNTTTEVNHGDSYSATLTAAELVLVTVGGVDCTEDYYNPTTRTITIDYVTGNVNIFATNESLVTLHYINKYITGSVYISNRDTLVVDGEAYTTTMTVNDGYQLDDIQILMGSEDITGTAWDSVNHTITISSVTDNVFITINTSLMGYYITYSLTGATSSTSVSKVMHGSSFSGTISPIRGYALDSCYYTMGNGSQQEVTITDGNAVISIEEVTGDLVITAAASILEYPITYDLHNANIEYRYASIPHGGDKTLVYTVEAGYDSRRPNVLVTGADFTVVTESRQILISNATGPVTVTVDPSDVYYIISTTTSNCTISTDFEGNTIRPNENYACTITASNGYIIDSLQVRVGDDIFRANTEEGSNPSVQIENTYKTTGTVIINAPYGDITITASAITSTVDVVNFLTNVITSNAATSVLRNSAYHAELTYDANTYKDMVVLVEMGGVNVTAQVVTNGVIDIPAVTGDLKITAYVVPYTYYNFMYTLNGSYLDYTPFQVREDKDYTSFYSSYIENPYIVVAVMMGDEDITNDCVNLTTRKIEIEEITGNVSISIQARPTRQPLTLAAIENMAIGDSKNILIGHPTIGSDGYFVGYSGTNFIKYGEGFESIQHTNAIANTISNDLDYRFILTKCQNMSGDPTVTRTYTFDVSGAFSSQTVTRYTTSISENIDENYTIYYTTLNRFGTAIFNSTQPTRNSTIEINYGGALYEGGLPQYIYVYMYKLVAANTVTATVNGGSGTITCKIGEPTDLSNLDNYDQIEVRSGSMTINSITLASSYQNATTTYGAHGIYIVVPKGVTLTIPNPNIEYVGDPYYTLQTDAAEDKYISVGGGARIPGEDGERPIISSTDHIVRVSSIKGELKIHGPSTEIHNEALLVLGINSENELLILSGASTLQTNSADIVHFNSIHMANITTMLTVYSEEDIWHLYEV